ncbi:uncharacterized protein LOC143916412 isoform X2 [Arctopsyche grandis]|uniref:uncharacterized protein LOC143916412 isoform X2 n=1 Tax=Arctopsyche grandis TaxID=121162 RepID=UPI00406DA3F9
MSPYELSTEIVFETKRHAEIACDVLRIDSEPKRSHVIKNISVNDNKLQIKLTSSELRNLRVSATSVFEHLLLSIETMETFGPAESDKYSFYHA